jgi:hypothetical protein
MTTTADSMGGGRPRNCRITRDPGREYDGSSCAARAAAGFVLRVALLVACSAASAEAQLVPFWDAERERWGYTGPDGEVAIEARFRGAGEFRDGQAPVEDGSGFFIIDERGTVVERIREHAAAAPNGFIPAPSADCAWKAAERFPGTGLECYIRQLGGDDPVSGGRIMRHPGPGERHSSVVVLRLRSGATIIERIGYEGFRRRVMLPGVTEEQAREWRRMLYPDAPVKMGCSESWTSGAVEGGAFIEQHAGC